MSAFNQNDFIRLCIDNDILRFGEFELKSGRLSPYFFNAGLFHNGLLAMALAEAYAHVIHQQFSNDDSIMLYGPAYKGIPLVATTAVILQQQYQRNISFCFNRKEKKDHGEGGNLVGAPLQDNVIILDDVITAGTSVHESVEIIRSAGANPAAVVIAVDRQEVANDETLSATEKVRQQYSMPVHSVISLEQLIAYISGESDYADTLPKITAYREKYGVSS